MRFSATFYLWYGVLMLLGGARAVRAQAWQWASAPAVSSTGSSSFAAAATDGAGNTIVVGSFNGTITLGTTTLTSAGGTDVVVARLNSAGSWTQAVRAGGTADDAGTAVAIAGNGEAVVTGAYRSTAITFGTTSLANAGSNDVFVARLSSAGAWTQAVSAGGTGNDEPHALALDGSGTAIVAGNFTATRINFGSLFLTNAGAAEIFVARLSSAGAWTQAVGAGGAGNDYANAMTVEAATGAVTVAGNFSGTTAAFGAMVLTNASTAGSRDLYVARLGAAGAWEWAVRAGGVGDEDGNALGLDGNGHLVVGGEYRAGSASFGTIVLPGGGDYSVYVARLNPATRTWAQAVKAGGIYDDFCYGLAVGPGSTVTAAGYSYSPAPSFGAIALTNTGAGISFVARLDLAGNWTQALQTGGAGAALASAVVLQNSSTATVTGYFSTPGVTFGATTVSTPASSGFVAQLTGLLTPACVAPASLSVGSISAGGAEVSFPASASALGYTLTYTAGGPVQTLASATSPITLSGLAGSTTYTVSVVSNCAGGASSPAVTTTFTTLPALTCQPPTALAVRNVTVNSAVIDFTPSASASGYTATYTATGGTSLTTALATPPLTLTTLAGGTTYTVSLVSNCVGGSVSAGSSVVFTTPVAFAVTGVSPARNAVAAPRAANVAATFSLPPGNTAASLGALKVFSSRRQGKMAGVATVAGNTLTFNPTVDFTPGETVFATVAALQSNSGLPLVQPQVFQFTAAAGAGSGTFVAGGDVGVGDRPEALAVGDVDNDGDLDFVVTNTGFLAQVGSTVQVRLNNGTGTFTGTASVAVGLRPDDVALADIDGDGDLDLLVANDNSNTVSVRFNNGTGTFQGGTDVPVGTGPQALAVADLDGDGDLDMATVNYGSNNLSVLLNNGTGAFSNGPTVAVGQQSYDLAVGDIDGDGDLDLLAPSRTSNAVHVSLNAGNGTFVAGPLVPTGLSPMYITLADLDADGRLDLMTSCFDASLINVRLNNGNGTFTSRPDVATDAYPGPVTAADFDGDGDLDLLICNGNGTVRALLVRLNNGSGIFSPAPSLTVPGRNFHTAAADVDNDGDLDLLSSNFGFGGTTPSSVGTTVTVRFNQGGMPLPSISGFTPSSGAAGTVVTLTGINFTGVTSITVNGVSITGFVVVSPTQITFTVPAGMGTGPITVTTPAGTATSLASFATLLASRNGQLPGLYLYPNPVSEALNIVVPAGIRVREVALRDALGRLVASVPQLPASGQLSLQHLPRGYYLLELLTDDGRVVTKAVMKE